MSARSTLAAAVAAVVVAALALTGASPAFAAKGPGKPGGGSSELAYVALGDSFAAGQGGGSYLDTSCYRSRNSYPQRLDATAKLKLTAFPACAGASTVETLASQVPAIPAGTQRVSLTIGGNDVGFASVMQNCFVFVSTTSCESRLATAETMVGDGTIHNRVASLVQAIRAKVGAQAKIVVAGYPQLFQLPSRYAYAARVNADTSALNDQVEAAAVANGATFVDVEAAFAGHGIGSSTPWINAFSIFNTTAAFHPNSTGYANYATLLGPALG
ncbi:SGNH/GDSL hydrolase family protein [Agromyces sp. NPDC057679]|uniref:SGNH/GDSL hydrolase family protein n=1 Tax=Agromyces sp. NPDC057679 TaxID=3346207 RepID=UPI00366BEDED